MESQSVTDPLPETEPTQAREALRQIIEVFRSGHLAASNLKESADHLTPHQLERELAAIEERMLTEISTICEAYDAPMPSIVRN